MTINQVINNQLRFPEQCAANFGGTMRLPMTGRMSRRAWTVPLAALAAALACVAAAVTPGAARAAAGPPLVWSAPAQVEKPPFLDRVAFGDVACLSASLCLAGDVRGNVFRSFDPASGSPTWQRITIPNSPDSFGAGITCPNISFCFAVVDGSPSFFTSTDPGSPSPHW